MKITAGHVEQLATTILAQNYEEPTPMPAFHREMWELCCSDHKLVAIAAPRAHAKTTAITGSYVITAVGFRERRYVLVISDTEEQAAEFLAEIKKEFDENDDLRQFFGVLKLTKDTQTDMVVQFTDGYQARILAKGAEQKVRGRKWRGTRPDLIVCDDLENEALVESETRREKMRRWFSGSVMPAGSDKCIFRMVGTILHFDSILERRMPKPGDPNTTREELKIYNTKDKEWACVKYQAHNEDFTEILWPEKFSRERLLALRKDQIEQGTPDVYSQEYLNEPISDDNAFFESRDFLPLSDRAKEGNMTLYASADLAISSADKSAFTVLAVVTLDAHGKIQVRDIRRGRWDSLRIIDECFKIQQRYEPAIFWIEKENIARSLGPVFNREMRDRNLFINFEEIIPTKDKSTRARPLQARMRAGAVLFDKEQEWYPDLEQEMRRFPKGAYMDQVDALSLAAFGISEMNEPYTDVEYDEILYQKEFGDSMPELGRDEDTGY